MKKTLKSALYGISFLAVLFVGVSLAISGGDTLVSQRDPTNSFNAVRNLPIPASNAVVTFDTSTSQPTYGLLGSGLSFDTASQNLSVANVPQSSIAGLASALAGKQNTITTGTTLQYLRGDLSIATFPTIPTIPTRVFNNAATHPIQTIAAAANGFQLSATQDTSVFYSVNVNTTATIGGASDGYVVLEINPANTANASDWKEVSRSRNGQTITLAIALNSVQNIGGELMNIVPAGYYARLRSVSVSGTPTFTYVSGQEVQL